MSCWAACLVAATGVGADPNPAIVKKSFIYEEAPFPSCHASTLAETPDGLVAAWFGGTDEGHKDVGIWVARLTEEGWTKPVEVANGLQESGARHPTWNPVLFQIPEGDLLLFFKVGPSPSRWWGEQTRSTDGGRTWARPKRLPDGFLGPVRNKPILLEDGRLLCGSSTEHAGWIVHMETTPDFGVTWEKSGPLNAREEFGAIQPTLLVHGDGRLQALCRSRQGVIVELWSDDQGRTWSDMARTSLPNPNSGIDGVTLQDGRHLLVYNHTRRGRSPLNVAISEDGKTWTPAVVLEDEPGEYSYPAVIQTSDGKVHITYTWKRQRIRHVILDPSRLP